MSSEPIGERAVSRAPARGGEAIRRPDRPGPNGTRDDPGGGTDRDPGPGERARRLRRTAEAAGPERDPKTEPKTHARPSRRRRRARRVHRVLRHVEVWSVFKFASIFFTCVYVSLMIAGSLLWSAAYRAGTIDGIAGFWEDASDSESFEIVGSVVFRFAAIGGFLVGVLCVALTVLGAVLFNLISDLTGGIRMTVIDEDLIVAPARPRSRQPAAPGRPAAPVPPDR